MSCPLCGVEVDFAINVAGLSICPNCKRSVVLTDEGVRPAVAADTLRLNPEQLTELRKARNRPARIH